MESRRDFFCVNEAPFWALLDVNRAFVQNQSFGPNNEFYVQY